MSLLSLPDHLVPVIDHLTKQFEVRTLLELDTTGANAIPRDNAVLETGFFISPKGKEGVLVMREKGSKMPDDLGGDIYPSLEGKSDITPIGASIRAFTENL